MPDYQSSGYVPILHSPGINDEFDKNMDPAKANILSLFPMILVQPYEQGMHLFVYSKTLNRKRGDLNYYGINKSITLKAEEDNAEGNYLMPSSICHEFQKFRMRIERQYMNKKPVLQLRRKFLLSKGKNSVLKGDDLSVKIFIENTGNKVVENIEIKMPIPSMAVNANDERIKDDEYFYIFLNHVPKWFTSERQI